MSVPLILPNQNELADMLRYKRPAGSPAEIAFREKFLTPLGVGWDAQGNGYKHIAGSNILWSSHTDTVHYTEGRQSIRCVSKVKDRCFAALADNSASSCLGADCTTGVFIMMNMIRNNIPGLYIFHYGEEKGCLGSSKIAKDQAKTLATYSAAIAFDRKGYTDIVEYQRGQRCCSKEFVSSLAKTLDMNYSASSGVYTDTGEYTDVIGECTNISVGYFSQHTADEYQDIDFALRLARRMCEVPFENLTFKRTAGSRESEYGGNNYYSGVWRGGKRIKPTTMYGLVDENTYAISRLLINLGYTFEEIEAFCDADWAVREQAFLPKAWYNKELAS